MGANTFALWLVTEDPLQKKLTYPIPSRIVEIASGLAPLPNVSVQQFSATTKVTFLLPHETPPAPISVFPDQGFQVHANTESSLDPPEGDPALPDRGQAWVQDQIKEMPCYARNPVYHPLHHTLELNSGIFETHNQNHPLDHTVGGGGARKMLVLFFQEHLVISIHQVHFGPNFEFALPAQYVDYPWEGVAIFRCCRVKHSKVLNQAKFAVGFLNREGG